QTSAIIHEHDHANRYAVRQVVNVHYTPGLRPILAAAHDAGDLRADADADACLALLLLLLPHIALAPHSAGLDPVLGLSSAEESDRIGAIDRLVDVLRAAFGPPAG